MAEPKISLSGDLLKFDRDGSRNLSTSHPGFVIEAEKEIDLPTGRIAQVVKLHVPSRRVMKKMEKFQ